jgi:hypothetical protein
MVEKRCNVVERVAGLESISVNLLAPHKCIGCEAGRVLNATLCTLAA